MKPWSARWIYPPGAPPSDYGVYHFRRSFELPSKPASFVVHVSGDNRYQLFVNGERVLWGPARGDLEHWRYETLDIASHLRAGKNVLAAVVWNFGAEAPLAQISYRTAFLLQGAGAEQVADTNRLWKCIRNEAYRALPCRSPMGFYYVAGPGDEVRRRTVSVGLGTAGFRRFAVAGRGRRLRGCAGRSRGLAQRMEAGSAVDSVDGRASAAPRADSEGQRVDSAGRLSRGPGCPPRSRCNQSRDSPGSELVNHRLSRADRIRRPGRVNQCALCGVAVAAGIAREGEPRRSRGQDLLRKPGCIPAGRRRAPPVPASLVAHVSLRGARLSRPRGDPLTVEDFRGVYTGYPFERRARFDAGSEELAKILDVGWRTARLCAHETYMDCPYYEQLQYAGRHAHTGPGFALHDRRRAADAQRHRAAERVADRRGLTSVARPPAIAVHPAVLAVVDRHGSRLLDVPGRSGLREADAAGRARRALVLRGSARKPGGSLGPVPWWNFVDWVGQWRNGVPPSGGDGSSAPLDLQLLLAYGWAAELESGLGFRGRGAGVPDARPRSCARRSASSTASRASSLPTHPERTAFSQHTNALAILAGAGRGQRGAASWWTAR